MSETMKDTFGSSDVFVSHLQAKMTANNVKSVSAQAISADTSKTPKAVVRHSSPDKGDTPDSDLDKTQSNSMGDYFWVWISVGVGSSLLLAVAAFAYSRRKKQKQHRVFGKGGAMSAMKMEMTGMMSQHDRSDHASITNPMNESVKEGSFDHAQTSKDLEYLKCNRI